MDPFLRTEPTLTLAVNLDVPGQLYRLDDLACATLLAASPAFIALPIPDPSGVLVLDLEQVDPVSEGFAFIESTSGLPGPVPSALHYRGTVRDGAGIAAITVFADGIMGLIADEEGQLVIGKLDGVTDGTHVMYRQQDLPEGLISPCEVVDVMDDVIVWDEGAVEGMRSTRCVKYYWEAAHDIYLAAGQDFGVASNFLTGLFNQVALLFQNDGIDIVLNAGLIWANPDPYDGSTSVERLAQFGDHRTSFNGDMANLLALGVGGGAAWTDRLCDPDSYYRMAYSGIQPFYNNVPTYSLSVQVISHEQGHGLGSRHTHACVWNGNDTAIDGCGPAIGYTEGTCPPGPMPSPAVGGTIMSYCHFTGSGINFLNGFGPQPGALILGRVNSASCLDACGTTCDAPDGQQAFFPAWQVADLVWNDVGADGYDLLWRVLGTGDWNLVEDIGMAVWTLNGLADGTPYEFQVRSLCGLGTSDLSPPYVFTTPAICQDDQEPNDVLAQATMVTIPAAIRAVIGVPGDVDLYRIELTAPTTLIIDLADLAHDYDLYLLDAAGEVLAFSYEWSTTPEHITYPALAGIFYIEVHGFDGVYDDLLCYLLTVRTDQLSLCPAPLDLAVVGTDHESALLQWSGVPDAGPYALRWRPFTDPEWIAIADIASTAYNLSDLSPSTMYQAQVAADCGHGIQLYSPLITFITAADPCSAGITCVPFAWLEGPFEASSTSMRDDLRSAGSLPLHEPYTAMGYPVQGLLTTTQDVLDVAGPQAVVDWILLELRHGQVPELVLRTQAGLLRADGSVIAPDGSPAINFCWPPGDYHLAIRHRNHLGCMTAGPIDFGTAATIVDLRDEVLATYGTDARKVVEGAALLWAGNAVQDGALKYTGMDNDRDPILQAIGGTIPTNIVSGYHSADITLDGLVKYTGAGNDRDPILSNVGGTVPSAVREEQLP